MAIASAGARRRVYFARTGRVNTTGSAFQARGSTMTEAVVPPVSVVLPVHNGAAYIGAAVESIRAQTLRNFELIIINDGSTDATAEIVGGCARVDERIRAIHLRKVGFAEALNIGIKRSQGKYVARMDADD